MPKNNGPKNKNRAKYLPISVIGRGVRNPTAGVFFNPHTPIGYNNPATVVITGAPGMGKSFLTQCLMTNDIEMGKIVVALDWKGDLAGIAENPEIADRCHLLAIGKEEDAGILDPFYSSTKTSEKLENILAMLDILLGGLEMDDRNLLTAFVEDTMKSKRVRPSMGAMIERLKFAENARARSFGGTLGAIGKTHIGQILFHKGKNPPRRIDLRDNGATIITVLGLDLPASESAARETESGRQATAVFYMLTTLINVLLGDGDKVPKSLYIDEAWAILQVPSGADMVAKIALLGRSRMLALILATQNYEHFTDAKIGNTMTTHFAFGARSDDAGQAIKQLGLPTRWKDVITGLENGVCIMKDFRNRFGVMEVIMPDYNPDWIDYFQTNPFEKAQRDAERKLEDIK